jgi:hypothetical protein
VAPFDIALVKLQSPLVFDENVQPISLPVPNSIPSGKNLTTAVFLTIT